MEVIIKCSDDCRGNTNIYGEPIEEIVRCKDCEYRNESKACSMFITYADDNDFCSWAKMKGGTE